MLKVIGVIKGHKRSTYPSLIFYIFLLIEIEVVSHLLWGHFMFFYSIIWYRLAMSRSLWIIMTHSLSLGSISPLVQWSLTKVILALGFGFNLTVRRLFLLSWLPKRLSPSLRSIWPSIDRPDPRPPWPLSRPSLYDRRCSSLLKGVRPPWCFWPSFEPIESRFSFSKKLFFLKNVSGL